MAHREVFVVAAARTAIGSFGGSLREVPLTVLATTVVRTALEPSGVAAEDVDHIVVGNVMPTIPRDAYLSRIAAIDSGIPKEAGALNVNRLCGSGLQAVISAYQMIALGDAHIAIGAGAESMSRAPYLLTPQRWGTRMGNSEALDYMLTVLHDPFENRHMGITAENVADRYGITRAMQDQLAFDSQTRATAAIAEERFKSQITPVQVTTRKGGFAFEIDEHVRGDTTLAMLARLKPVFKNDGVVTAGNASGINDGAAALVLASADRVRALNLIPMARIVAYAHAGVDPAYMGIGPVPATQLALKRAGLKVHDLNVVESNEAFAAQACAVIRELDLDPGKVNPNGSGISLGHPVGATGAIITAKAIYELHRTKKRYALGTMCIGGGQGIAAIVERV